MATPTSAAPTVPKSEIIVRQGEIEITVERKKFIFRPKSNDRGQFVEIVEDINGRRDMIVVPRPGLVAFRDALTTLIDAV